LVTVLLAGVDAVVPTEGVGETLGLIVDMAKQVVDVRGRTIDFLCCVIFYVVCADFVSRAISVSQRGG
jgi:hypothetical protein